MKMKKALLSTIVSGALLSAAESVPLIPRRPLTPPPADDGGRIWRMVPMRDGVKLCTMIDLPAKPGKYPVRLERTPYSYPDKLFPLLTEKERRELRFVRIRQDVRGTGQSEGNWTPWVQEIDDGKDMLDWIVKQPFSDGRVVMCGGSYPGAAQFFAAMSGHPALIGISPNVAPWDFRNLPKFYGGIKCLSSNEWMFSTYWKHSDGSRKMKPFKEHLPLKDMDAASGIGTFPFYQEMMKHTLRDEFWDDLNFENHVGKMRTPAHFYTGWWDIYTQPMLDALASIRAKAATPEARAWTRCVVGPWTHAGYQRPVKGLPIDAKKCRFPGDFRTDLKTRTARFEAWRNLGLTFLQNLLDHPGTDPLPGEPVIRYYMLGADEWRSTAVWPPAGSKMTPFYFAGEGKLARKAEFVSASDSYISDPAHPVPTRGGHWSRPSEQTAVILKRKDILLCQSEVLTSSVTIAGRVKAHIFFRCSRPDTDFIVKLCDTFPDGRTYLLALGAQRARFRNGECKAELLEPGKTYQLTVDLQSIANCFHPGHRITVIIAGQDFPALARNNQTGNEPATDTELCKAEITLLHDAEHPSRIELPLLPE